MPDISKITLPSGTTYDIKDTVARVTAAGGLQFRGVTTTILTDGATTTTYSIDEDNYTAANGDLVIYGSKEFVFSTTDNKWHELGDNTSLKALAYKDSATGSYKPEGTVSQPTFTGSSSNVTITSTADTSGNYQPAGTISTPTINKVGNGGTTETIHNPTKVIVAKTIIAQTPSATQHPSNNVVYYSVEDETLSLFQIGYTTGDSITTSDVTVKTGDASYTATQPTFTGTKVQLAGTTTAAGTVSQPTFTGTNKTVTVS